MQKQHLFVGTYTHGTESRGIYTYALGENGDLGYRSVCGDGVNDPSYLCQRGGYLYAANERGRGQISAYRIHPVDSALQYMNGLDTAGEGMCHLSAWPNGPYLSAACYTSGTFVSCALSLDGLAASFVQLHQDEGGGPCAERQDGPHAHSITPSPSGRYQIGCDLGTDQLWVFATDANTGHFVPHPSPAGGFVKTPGGQGPRHVAFNQSGTRLYVLCELGNTIQVYDWDDLAGTLLHRQTVSTLPEGFTGENTAAEVHLSPDGRFLYASNRGHNSIAVFRVYPKEGTLTPAGHFACGGDGPRSFDIDPTGKILVVANQYSGSLASFGINKETGTLTGPLCTVAVPAAVCVKFRRLA